MYEVCKEVVFAAAHSIRGHPGKCSRLHGHNWRVRLCVVCRELDEMGIGVDFAQVKDVLYEITGGLDHQNLNDLDAFAANNPTAENLARFLFDEASRRLDAPGRRVSEVTVWETETSSVRYRRDPAR